MAVVNYEKTQPFFSFFCLPQTRCMRNKESLFRWHLHFATSAESYGRHLTRRKKQKSAARAVVFVSVTFQSSSHSLTPQPRGVVSRSGREYSLACKLQTLAFCLPAFPSTQLKQLFAPLDKFVLLSPSESSDDLKCTYSCSESQRILDWGFNLPNQAANELIQSSIEPW